jgi:hypothetical protein
MLEGLIIDICVGIGAAVVIGFIVLLFAGQK